MIFQIYLLLKQLFMPASESTLSAPLLSTQSIESSELNIGSWELHVKLVCDQLNEKHRRWVAGLLSEALGWGGTKRISELTDLDPKTIRQGRIDLQNNLEGYCADRVREKGAGRPLLKKKISPLSKI